MKNSTLALLLCGLAACSQASEANEEEVAVTVYGEEFIEEGIPSSEMADGWSVTFDTFLVTVKDVTIADVTLTDFEPIDIANKTDGMGHTLATPTVPAGEHSGSQFTISRVEMAGSASKEGITKNFAWTFEQETHYTNCQTTTSVGPEERATFQITVHADHFFYDSLVAEEPQVVFQALADADSDEDGTITRAELEATGIGSYDPGNDDTVNDLWTWLEAQSRTLGHVDGEGHCDAQ